MGFASLYPSYELRRFAPRNEGSRVYAITSADGCESRLPLRKRAQGPGRPGGWRSRRTSAGMRHHPFRYWRTISEAAMNETNFPGETLRPLRLQIGAQSIAGYESLGTGRSILLVHGNSSSSRIWQKQLQGPLGRKYRLVAIDLPGHGASSPPPNPEQDYSGYGYSACIVAVARELGLKETVVVGWSLGGHAVLNAAASLPTAAGLAVFGKPPLRKGPDGRSG